MPALGENFLICYMLDMPENQSHNIIQFWENFDVASHIEDLLKSVACNILVQSCPHQVDETRFS